jgi:hypothetical protein
MPVCLPRTGHNITLTISLRNDSRRGYWVSLKLEDIAKAKAGCPFPALSLI